MPFPLTTTISISVIALVVAYLVNLAAHRFPFSRNVAIGIVAAVVIFISVDLWFGLFHTLESGSSTDCSRAGSCRVMLRDTSPVMFWSFFLLKTAGITALSCAGIWVARQSLRRNGNAA